MSASTPTAILQKKKPLMVSQTTIDERGQKHIAITAPATTTKKRKHADVLNFDKTHRSAPPIYDLATPLEPGVVYPPRRAKTPIQKRIGKRPKTAATELLENFKAAAKEAAQPVAKCAAAASAAGAVPAAPPEHSSLPPADDGAAGHGGDGGCTASALAAMGVWHTAAEAAAALNAQIEPLHRKWLGERGPCDESEAGIRNEQWHELAIFAALKDKIWHARKVNMHPTKKGAVSLNEELKRGQYLIFGIANNRWSKRIKRISRFCPRIVKILHPKS
jgi:hypothetical protein